MMRLAGRKPAPKPLRDAIARLRGAILDLTSAGCHAEAAELAALVQRLEARA